MSDLKTIVKNLRINYHRVNEGWFKEICEKEFLYSKEFVKEYFINFSKGVFNFIETCPEELVVRIATIEIQEQVYISLHGIDVYSDWRKIIYKNTQSKKVESIELNFLSHYDLQKLIDIGKNNKDEIITVLKLVAEIDAPKKIRYSAVSDKEKQKKTKIYEYDLIGVCETEWHKEKMLIFAQLHENSPCFQELIWTKKFGYLNSDKKLFKSDEEFKSIDSLLNSQNKYLSSYLVEGKDDYEVVGNFYTHAHLLLPE